MQKILTALALALLVALARPASSQTCQLENQFFARKVAVVDGRLKTVELRNKRCQKVLTPTGAEEFRLRLSHGVDSPEADTLLTAADFDVVSLKEVGSSIVADLRDAQHGLQITVDYSLASDKPYGHKYLEIVSSKAWTLELVDIESIALPDAVEP